MHEPTDPNESLAPDIVEKLHADFFYKDVREKNPDAKSLHHLGFDPEKHQLFTEKAYGFKSNGVMLAQTSRIIAYRDGNELLKTVYDLQEFNMSGEADGRHLRLRHLPEDHPDNPMQCMETASVTFYQNGRWISQKNGFDLRFYDKASLNMRDLEAEYNAKRNNPPAPTAL